MKPDLYSRMWQIVTNLYSSEQWEELVRSAEHQGDAQSKIKINTTMSRVLTSPRFGKPKNKQQPREVGTGQTRKPGSHMSPN